MSDLLVAKRYAVALFNIAKEQNLLDQIEEELRTIKEVFTTDKDFVSFLKHPKVTRTAKKDVVAKAFAGATTSVAQTLQLMVDRHRIDAIAPLADAFIELNNEENSIADAIVYSVRPLTDAETEAVSTSFAAKIGKKTLRVQNVTDSNLLGGIKLRIGNRIYDGSISGKLDRLSKQLLG